MQVLKFGGTSVAAPEKLVDIVCAAVKKDRTVLVCSAVSGCTDALIRLGQLASDRDKTYLSEWETLRNQHFSMIETLLPADRVAAVKETVGQLFDSLAGILYGVFLLGELSPASLDAVESYGELFSTRILAAKFSSLGIACEWLDAREIVRTSDGTVDTAVTYANIAKAVSEHPRTGLFIVPGFLASDEQGRTTTLGRGGSDYTAALLAVGVGASRVEIWTDVPGIMTADPRMVPTARPIRNISYRAAQELSHFGAKVIFPPTIQPVVHEGIPICVKNTFDPEDPGTRVEKEPPLNGDEALGISHSDDIALISLEGSGMVGVPGFSSRLFDALTRSGINIILITQASSVHTMCIAIAAQDAPAAKKAADNCFAYEISLGRLNPLKVETGYSIVCLVGDDILGHSGATGRMLAALGGQDVPVRATAQGSSERNISVIVSSDKAAQAVRAIHNEFFDKGLACTATPFFPEGKRAAPVRILRENAPLRVAVVGATGLVGTKMLEVLEERRFPVAELIPAASERSAGRTVCFGGRTQPVVSVAEALERKPALALFSAGAEVSREWAPQFAAAGCRVVDNSSCWRMDPDKKLVVPEINADVLTDKDFIIANPNCSTIQMLLPLSPLHQAFTIRRIVVSTYQSVSGTGREALAQLKAERSGAQWGTYPAVYPYPIEGNMLPQIDAFLEDGSTKEERKMADETRKILRDGRIGVSATTVRVPVRVCHSESVNLEFEKPFTLSAVRQLLSDTPGVVLFDDPAQQHYPMPLFAEGRDEVFVGRVRRDASVPSGLNLWCVADNLRKGAALNAVQIAEVLLDQGFI